MFRVRDALAAPIVFWLTLLFADSAPLLLTARTAKYQVPVPSAKTTALVAEELLTAVLCARLDEFVPKSTRKPERLVSVVPSTFCVGRVQLTVAVPPPQLQVIVYEVLAVIVGSVSVPDANLLPLQPPLAAQLVATGDVDQVSTGARLPVAVVWFAEKLMVPAV